MLRVIGAAATKRVAVRSLSTNAYLSAYHDAMHELTLLGHKPGSDLTPLKTYFDAVVLPLRRAYAWGVPSEDALQAIAEFASPHGIVEVGAGTGYWAHLLEAKGVSVRAFDATPCHGSDLNGFHAFKGMGNVLPFTRVSAGGAEAAAMYSERTLFLCWPPREADGSGTGERDVAMMAADALAHYTGPTVAYVGVCAATSAGHGGVPASANVAARHDTAGECFEAALASQFQLEREVALPNWPPVRDSLTLWRRKSDSPAASAPASVDEVDDFEPDAPQDATATERRARARAASLAELRWSDFDRGYVAATLVRWARRKQAGGVAAPEEVEMLHRCLARAPLVSRVVGRNAARLLR